MPRKVAGVLLASVVALLLLVVVSGNKSAGNNFFNGNSDIPLPNTNNRPQLLRFGMYVTPDPEQNPIDPPERFTGYHTGLDLEIFDHEKDERIPVAALCPGKIVQSGFAAGYGGLIVQQCIRQGESVTVLYGHLHLDSLAAENATIKRGETIGILADEYSYDSGETRKHLHLTIHRGTDMDIRGYVQTEEELNEFIDPQSLVGK